MRAVYSFGVNDSRLVEAINAFKESGGNLSKLICNLLEHYFFGNNDKEVITKEMLLLLDIKKKIEEFYEWREEILPKIEELEAKIKEKQEEEQIKNEQPPIEELRNDVFRDILEEGFENFSRRIQRLGRRPEDAIKTRLNSWASEKQIPFPKAVELFSRAFPDLKGLFEVEVKA